MDLDCSNDLPIAPMNMNIDMPPAEGISIESVALDGTIVVPTVTFADGKSNENEHSEGQERVAKITYGMAYSKLSTTPSIDAAELIELSAGDGAMLYYPSAVEVDVGDVFYLRERNQGENGIIVQIIHKETAKYPQVESKVLWRLLTAVYAEQVQRTHHEPADVIDQFLVARFKVRASIVDGQWRGVEGRIVTRNVDIFVIDPSLLTHNILTSQPTININLGEFKGQPVEFSGEGLDKINLVTGMKGAGKSHITKGIIDESRKRGMSAVIFDINDEYGGLPNAVVFKPGENLKFRMDRVNPQSIIEIIERLAPFAERTGVAARAMIPKLIVERVRIDRCPDVAFLREQASVVFPDGQKWMESMQSSYRQSLDIMERYNLFATEQEAKDENERIKTGKDEGKLSLSSEFARLARAGDAGVLVFSIGSLMPSVQISIVRLVLDALKEICDRQFAECKKNPTHVPVYPTVFFEEAHMYMDPGDINELIPLIRHQGMNLFFITNTPCDLPDSVFRLLDNLIMTRMLNESDINKVASCGLVDKETIVGFASQLPDYYALLLSGKDRVTKGFPLVFKVRDFGLPKSGITRSMWRHLGRPKM